MDRRRLEAAAAEYSYFRGLLLVPCSLLLVLSALGNWQWGLLRHTWAFLCCLVLIGAVWLLIDRYYKQTYGRVTLSARQQARAAMATVIFASMIFGGSLLVRSRADWSLDLPVNPVAATFALGMLIFYAVTVGVRAHHIAILGSLLVVGALPVWRGGDPSNIGLVLAGFAVLATGLLDHRLLVRAFGPSTGLNLENGDAGAL